MPPGRSNRSSFAWTSCTPWPPAVFRPELALAPKRIDVPALVRLERPGAGPGNGRLPDGRRRPGRVRPPGPRRGGEADLGPRGARPDLRTTRHAWRVFRRSTDAPVLYVHGSSPTRAGTRAFVRRPGWPRSADRLRRLADECPGARAALTTLTLEQELLPASGGRNGDRRRGVDLLPGPDGRARRRGERGPAGLGPATGIDVARALIDSEEEESEEVRPASSPHLTSLTDDAQPDGVCGRPPPARPATSTGPPTADVTYADFG